MAREGTACHLQHLNQASRHAAPATLHRPPAELPADGSGRCHPLARLLCHPVLVPASVVAGEVCNCPWLCRKCGAQGAQCAGGGGGASAAVCKQAGWRRGCTLTLASSKNSGWMSFFIMTTTDDPRLTCAMQGPAIGACTGVGEPAIPWSDRNYVLLEPTPTATGSRVVSPRSRSDALKRCCQVRYTNRAALTRELGTEARSPQCCCSCRLRRCTGEAGAGAALPARPTPDQRTLSPFWLPWKALRRELCNDALPRGAACSWHRALCAACIAAAACPAAGRRWKRRSSREARNYVR